MTTNSYCDASPVTTREITSSIDLENPSFAQDGALAIYPGMGGRASAAPHLPAVVVHRRFLLPHLVDQLSHMLFTPEFQRSFAEEASAAIGYRSHSLEVVSAWLGQYVRRCPFTGSSNLFSNVDRLYTPPALPPGSTQFLSRPALYICLTAPTFDGARFASPGYPGSAIRLYPGDAVLCQSHADERFHIGEGSALFLRLYGALGPESGPPPYVPSVNFMQPPRQLLSITLPPSPALTSSLSPRLPPTRSVSLKPELADLKWADQLAEQKKEIQRREAELAVQLKEVEKRENELSVAMLRAAAERSAEKKAAEKKEAERIAAARVEAERIAAAAIRAEAVRKAKEAELANSRISITLPLPAEAKVLQNQIAMLEARIKLDRARADKEKEKAAVQRAEADAEKQKSARALAATEEKLAEQQVELEMTQSALDEVEKRAVKAEAALLGTEKQIAEGQRSIEAGQARLAAAEARAAADRQNAEKRIAGQEHLLSLSNTALSQEQHRAAKAESACRAAEDRLKEQQRLTEAKQLAFQAALKESSRRTSEAEAECKSAKVRVEEQHRLIDRKQAALDVASRREGEAEGLLRTAENHLGQAKARITDQLRMIEVKEAAVRAAEKRIEELSRLIEAKHAAFQASLKEATRRTSEAEAERQKAESRIRDQTSLRAELVEARRQIEVADQGMAALIEYNRRHPRDGTPTRVILGEKNGGAGQNQLRRNSSSRSSVGKAGRGAGHVAVRLKVVKVKVEPLEESAETPSLDSIFPPSITASSTIPTAASADAAPSMLRTDSWTPRRQQAVSDDAGDSGGKRRRL